MTMVRLRTILLVQTCAFALGLLTPASAETLPEAVSAALNNHPSVTAAIANRDALKEEREEKWSDFMPQLNINASGGRIYGDNATSRGLSVTRGAGYSGYGQGGVSLNQLLYDGAETAGRLDAAEARRDSANFSISDVREQLALRTVISYLDIMRSQEMLALLRDQGKKINTYIGRIQKMVDEGGADASMTEMARDIRAQLDNTIAATEGQLRAAGASYMELTGRPPEDPMKMPDAPGAVLPADAAQAIVYAHDNHPALRAAALSEESFAADAEAERRAIIPDITGQLSYNQVDQKDIIGGESTDARAIIRLNWDYSTGGAQAARTHKALYRRSESLAQRMDRQRRIEREIETAFSESRMADEQMKIQKTRVGINEGLLKTSQAQFEAAKANILQIMQADNNLFNAKLALMTGEYRSRASQYAILASMGRLQEALNIGPAPAADEQR